MKLRKLRELFDRNPTLKPFITHKLEEFARNRNIGNFVREKVSHASVRPFDETILLELEFDGFERLERENNPWRNLTAYTILYRVRARPEIYESLPDSKSLRERMAFLVMRYANVNVSEEEIVWEWIVKISSKGSFPGKTDTVAIDIYPFPRGWRLSRSKLPPLAPPASP